MRGAQIEIGHWKGPLPDNANGSRDLCIDNLIPMKALLQMRKNAPQFLENESYLKIESILYRPSPRCDFENLPSQPRDQRLDSP